MRTYHYILVVLLFTATMSFAQTKSPVEKKNDINILLDFLWANPTSFFNNTDPNWQMLCNNLQYIDLQKINKIKDSIFSSSHAQIQNKSISSEGMLGFLNKESRSKRIKNLLYN